MTRTAHAAATDAISKLQQIAAKDLGGRPEDYEVSGERVHRKGGGAGMSLAQAAKRAIELGGIYDGHELPKDINAMTTRSATALAGQGLMGVAKDNYKHDGTTRSFTAAFAEVEVDTETGKYTVTDFLSVADVGTVIHPNALGGQITGPFDTRHRSCDRSPLDVRPAVRSAVAKRFYNNKPDDDSRRAAQHRLGCRRHPRSGNAGRRARHRRAACRVRLQFGAERDFRLRSATRCSSARRFCWITSSRRSTPRSRGSSRSRQTCRDTSLSGQRAEGKEDEMPSALCPLHSFCSFPPVRSHHPNQLNRR